MERENLHDWVRLLPMRFSVEPYDNQPPGGQIIKSNLKIFWYFIS